MNAPSGSPGYPDWKLERYLLEELPFEEMEQIRQDAATDQRLSQRLQDLRQSDGEILVRHDPVRMSRQIQRQLHGPAALDLTPRGSWLRRLSLPMAAPAVALVAIFALLPVLRSERQGEQVESPLRGSAIRIKGSASQLILHRKTYSGTEPLADGTEVRAGDRLGIQYRVAEASHGLILSVDGRGAVTRHFPDAGDLAAPLEPGTPVQLDFSYELDDAPEWEKFYLVTSPQAFAVDAVMEAASVRARRETSSDSLELAPLLKQSIITLRKPGPKASDE